MNPLGSRDVLRTGQGWPSTLRFSRRLGEALRDAEYAIAIERPAPRVGLAATVAALWRCRPWRRATA